MGQCHAESGKQFDSCEKGGNHGNLKKLEFDVFYAAAKLGADSFDLLFVAVFCLSQFLIVTGLKSAAVDKTSGINASFQLVQVDVAFPAAHAALLVPFEDSVGEGGSLMAENAAETKKLEIKTPSLRITVKAEMADMIKTRFIDGIEYLTIPVADDIEVNGIRILQSRKES